MSDVLRLEGGIPKSSPEAGGGVDDIQETSFSASNNVSVATDITGFSFNSANVRSFIAQVSIEIDATTDLLQEVTITGVQLSSSWVIATTVLGDTSNITFSITTGGQVQYTSGNEVGYVSSAITFRAEATSRSIEFTSPISGYSTLENMTFAIPQPGGGTPSSVGLNVFPLSRTTSYGDNLGSVTSEYVTLSAGDYRFKAIHQARAYGKSVIRVYDVTSDKSAGGGTLIDSGVMNDVSGAFTGKSVLNGNLLTLAGTRDIEFRFFAEFSDSNGLGNPGWTEGNFAVISILKYS